MSISVVVPYRPGCPDRERSWAWVREQYARHHPSWEVVTGESPDGPFNRSAAIIDGASKASGERLVIADSDVWCPLDEALANLEMWAVPHLLVHRLSPGSSSLFMGGTPLPGLELSSDNRRDSRPYRGFECGTLVILTRDTFDEVQPDPRFVGWGQEDEAWSFALRTLIGAPWRGTEDLVHLWHPPQERLNRGVGTREGAQLRDRYRRAKGKPALMRQLLEGAAA